MSYFLVRKFAFFVESVEIPIGMLLFEKRTFLFLAWFFDLVFEKAGNVYHMFPYRTRRKRSFNFAERRLFVYILEESCCR